jgi:uroporphyrinogen-III synthase
MRLLVTRPIEDSQRLAAKLRALGHDPVVAPLMNVYFLEGAALSLDGIQAVLATSANGVRALARRTARRDLVLLAVGPQTAETAAEHGFASITSAQGDAVALAELVAARLDSTRGPLFHAAGAETAGRLRQRLEALGFSVESEILYTAQAVAPLPKVAADALASGELDGVMVFSPRSARIFSGLVTAATLEAACARLDAYCISAAAAEALSPIAFARMAVAGSPNEGAIFSLLTAPGRVA